MLQAYEPIVLLIVEIIKMAAVATVIMVLMNIILLVERKGISRLVRRYGPNRVGPFGFFQPIADAIKMFFKEEMVPGHVNSLIYVMAPGMALVPGLLAFAVIPFARDPITLPLASTIGFDITLTPWIADVNIGVLYILAVGSIGSYGVVLGGWSSNNKYSLLGGLRTSAQILSYELPMGVAILAVVLMTGTMQVREIVEWQTGWEGLRWLIVLQPVAFIIFFISGLAEAGRAPFDLPETENELIGGFMTEYGALKFGLFQAAEFVHAMIFCSIVVTMFLGGWNLPLLSTLIGFAPETVQPYLGGVIYPVVFALKCFCLYLTLIWIRASVPRMRFDQLMAFCWKILLPLGLANLIATALILAVLFFGNPLG